MRYILLAITIGLAPLLLNPEPRQAKEKSASYHDYSVTLYYGKPATRDQTDWWGGYESRPQSVVYSMVVKYKGKRVPVPRSVYADLAEVNRLFFRTRGKDVELHIEGGDAADGYDCVISFSSGWPHKRRVADGEFPDRFYQETTYVNR